MIEGVGGATTIPVSVGSTKNPEHPPRKTRNKTIETETILSFCFKTLLPHVLAAGDGIQTIEGME